MSVWFACLAALAGGAAPGAHTRLMPLDEPAYRQVLAGHRGRVVLVSFWATWCSPCLEEMPRLVSLERNYRGRGLRLVTVSCDEAEDQAKAERVLHRVGALQPAYIKRVADDDRFIRFIDGNWSGALPALFLYDRRGRLVRSFIGETEINVLENAVRSVL